MTKKATTPKVATPPNPFGFEAPKVDSSLYTQKRESYPSAIWLSRFDGDADVSRPWVIDIEDLSAMPEPFWRPEMIRFGNDPNEPETPVFMTEVLRAVPLGARKRQIVEDAAGVKHYYHIYTGPNNRAEGRLTFHYQVLVSLPGLPYNELVVLGLRGLTKTLSWQHDGRRYDGFPVGVENKLLKYSDDAKKAVGGEMPMFCSWWVDMRGAYSDNKPHYISVGPDGTTFVQPFTADLRTSNAPHTGSKYNKDGSLVLDEQGLPFTRYVGPELFEKYQELRRDIIIDWEKEWAAGEIEETPTRDEGTDGNGSPAYNGAPPVGTEETPNSDIPF